MEYPPRKRGVWKSFKISLENADFFRLFYDLRINIHLILLHRCKRVERVGGGI